MENWLATIPKSTALSTNCTANDGSKCGRIAVIIAACAFMALLAFFIFNKHPAHIFPGDTLTYPIGTIIAIIAILGNIEKFALILFIPYLIEGLLKARGKMQKESF